MQFLYLAVICMGIVGMGIIDWRYKLALFYDARRTNMVVGSMVLIFLLWDIAGVELDIFFAGTSLYTTKLFVLPDVPVEELFFLTLLSYMPLVLYRKFHTA